MKIRTLIITAAAGSALALAGASVPALASVTPTSPPGPITASVTTLPGLYITLSGLTNVTFPQMRAGSTDNAAEQYTVETTDTGYTVSITAGDTALRDGTTSAIPNSNVTLTDTGSGAAGPVQLQNGGSPVTLASVSGLDGNDHTNAYTEGWALAIPAATPAGTYSEQFTYAVIGA